MDLSTLERLFGQPETYRWVPLSALKAGEYLSCIDGRHEECIVAAPGGDLGEFVLMLASIEAVTGKRFSIDEIEACMKEVMDWHSRFYMHSDQIALGGMSKALQGDARFEDVSGLDDLERLANFLRHPPRRYREDLEAYLVNPEYTGCGHLRLMLERSGDYGVRRELVEGAVLSFYHRMWDGSPSPNFVVLSGVHEESAVLVIELPGEAEASTFVPAIRGGQLGDGKAFVVHEPARHFLRSENLHLLANAAAVDPTIDTEKVEAEMDRAADHHLATTSKALADGLPMFEIDFDARTHELTIKPL